MTPEEFEQQVERLFRSIEAPGAKITWNKKIKNPSDGKSRQIDVEIIREDGTIVHVECRNQGRKQTKQWIENLIGRKHSLGADLVIAVSSSKFVDGAHRKANDHGILTFVIGGIEPEQMYLFIYPPILMFPIFRNVSIEIDYFVSRFIVSTFAKELGSRREQVENELCAVLLKKILESTDYEIFWNNSGPFSIARKMKLEFRCGHIECEIRLKATASWELGILKMRNVAIQGAKNKLATAEIFIFGFEGIIVEVVASADKLLISVDRRSFVQPPQFIIGNAVKNSHIHLSNHSTYFRVRHAEEIEFSFPLKDRIYSGTGSIIENGQL